MQAFDLLSRLTIAGPASEYPFRMLQQLLLPGVDLRRMDLVVHRQLGDRGLLPQCFEGDLRLQSRVDPPSRSAHRPSVYTDGANPGYSLAGGPKFGGHFTLSLRQIEVFRLVMQTRNLTESARLLRVSQPAVSQTLKEMENQLGLTLFERSASRISPTGEARMLLPHVERLAAQGATVDSRAAELRDGSAGLLSLASPSNFAGVVLPAAVAAFVRERPRVQIEVNAYVRREEVVRQLQQERADLGFLYAPIEEPGFAVEPIMEARMVCVLPQASPLAELSEVSPKQLLSAGVVITATSGSPGELLRVHLAQLGLRLVNVIETNFSYAALGLVRQGIGVFVTDPLILMSGLSSDVVVRRLVPELRVTLTMIYHRQRPVPRLAVRFMANLHDTLASMCASQAPSVCEAKAI